MGIKIRPRLVIFDLDGTLIDTAPDLAIALNHVLSKEGLGGLDLATAQAMVSKGGKDLLRKSLTRLKQEFDEEYIVKMYKPFRQYYEEHIADKSRLYPYSRKVLYALREQGISLAICTNKGQDLTDKLLSIMSLSEYFDIVVGSKDDGILKPDPRILLRVLDASNFTASEALMIGDSLADVLAAKALSIRFILAEFGYGEGLEGSDIEIEHRISDFKQLSDFFKRAKY